MTTRSHMYSKIWNDIRLSSNANGLLEILDRIHRFSDVEMSQDERDELALTILQELRTSTRNDSDLAFQIINNWVIPACLKNEGANSKALSHYRCRTLLREWLEQYPENQHISLTKSVLGILENHLSKPSAANACSAIAEIGFRDPGVVGRLFDLANRDGDAGHAALYSLTAIGVPVEYRERVISMLDKIVSSDVPEKAVACIKQIASPETLDLTERLIEKLSEVRARDQSKIAYLHISLSALASIARELADTESAQDRIWNTLRIHRDIIAVGTGLADSCNSSMVVPELLDWLSESGDSEAAIVQNWRIFSRLDSCLRPRQLESWADRRSLRALPILRQAACVDTKNTSRGQSLESRAKSEAWQWIMSIGVDDLAEWIESAVAAETSPYVQNAVLDAASAAAVRFIPDSVRRLVTQEINCESNDGRNLLPRLAATKLVSSAGSIEAFKILLDFGLTHDGHVLLDSAQCLADVAVWLTSEGKSIAWDDLLSAMHATRPPRQREAACRALHDLAILKLAPNDSINHYLGWIEDDTLPLYSRGELVASLQGFPSDDIGRIITPLSKLAERVPPDEASWQALALLVRHMPLPDAEIFASKQLGWAPSNGEPSRDDIDINGWRAWILGELFVRNSERFAPALAYVIQLCDSHTSFQLAKILRRSGRVPSIVAAAIRNRIEERVLPYVAETHLFSMLASADPHYFISQRWDDLWRQWRPESKAAFLNAHLAMDIKDTDVRGRVVAVFCAASGSGSKIVRETAYKNLARVDLDSLIGITRDWASNDSTDLRIRAAESMVWIPFEALAMEAFTEQLKLDPVRAVRVTASEAIHSCRQRSWTRSYLEQVKSLRTSDNHSLFRVYPFGRALGKWGDGTDFEELQSHLASENLPPNVRRWLESICDEIEGRLTKLVMKEEQSLWYGWDYVVDEFSATLESDGLNQEATVILWRRPPSGPGELGTWTGTAMLASETTLPVEFLRRGAIKIRSRGRSVGNAIVSAQLETRLFLLHGSGEYPVVVQD